MKATQTLHDQGQSLWLDNITRDLLRSGTLERYIKELSVTSNPTIFDHAIKNRSAYDTAIRNEVERGKSGGGIVLRPGGQGFDAGRGCVSTDLGQCARVDGWVSLEVSPLLATTRAARPPRPKPCAPALDDRTWSSRFRGPRKGCGAIEQAIFAGMPVNVTLLLLRDQYVAAAEAFSRGAERRVSAGLESDVAPSLRCSSAGGTRLSGTTCRKCCAIGSASR
jgi:transaldolase